MVGAVSDSQAVAADFRGRQDEDAQTVLGYAQQGPMLRVGTWGPALRLGDAGQLRIDIDYGRLPGDRHGKWRVQLLLGNTDAGMIRLLLDPKQVARLKVRTSESFAWLAGAGMSLWPPGGVDAEVLLAALRGAAANCKEDA